MNRAFLFCLAALVALALVACRSEPLPENDVLIAAFEQGRTGVWLSGHGTVVRELVGDGQTQRWQVRVTDGISLVVRHRLQGADRLVLDRGDVIAFHGRYEFHGGGGEIHLTHADPSQPGGGGWIRHRGVRYD